MSQDHFCMVILQNNFGIIFWGERSQQVSAKSGSFVQLGAQKVSVVWSSGMSVIQGLEVSQSSLQGFIELPNPLRFMHPWCLSVLL